MNRLQPVSCDSDANVPVEAGKQYHGERAAPVHRGVDDKRSARGTRYSSASYAAVVDLTFRLSITCGVSLSCGPLMLWIARFPLLVASTCGFVYFMVFPLILSNFRARNTKVLRFLLGCLLSPARGANSIVGTSRRCERWKVNSVGHGSPEPQFNIDCGGYLTEPSKIAA